MSSNKTITTPASRRRGGEEVTPGLKVTEDLKLTVSLDQRGRCRADYYVIMAGEQSSPGSAGHVTTLPSTRDTSHLLGYKWSRPCPVSFIASKLHVKLRCAAQLRGGGPEAALLNTGVILWLDIKV